MDETCKHIWYLSGCDHLPEIREGLTCACGVTSTGVYCGVCDKELEGATR